MRFGQRSDLPRSAERLWRRSRIERAHGSGKHILQAHAGPLQDEGATYSDLLICRLDGPQSEQELAHPQTLHPTDWAKQFVRLWRQEHGARFRVYHKAERRSPKKKARHRAGTDSLVRSQQVLGLAKRSSASREASSSTSTVIPGLSQAKAVEFIAGRQAPSAMGLGKFCRRTQILKQWNQGMNQRRRLRENPFPAMQLARAKLFSEPQAEHPGWARLCALRRWRVVDLCKADVLEMPAPAPRELRVLRLFEPRASSGILTSCSQAHMAVVERLDDLASASPKLARLGWPNNILESEIYKSKRCYKLKRIFLARCCARKCHPSNSIGFVLSCTVLGLRVTARLRINSRVRATPLRFNKSASGRSPQRLMPRQAVQEGVCPQHLCFLNPRPTATY